MCAFANRHQHCVDPQAPEVLPNGNQPTSDIHVAFPGPKHADSVPHPSSSSVENAHQSPYDASISGGEGIPRAEVLDISLNRVSSHSHTEGDAGAPAQEAAFTLRMPRPAQAASPIPRTLDVPVATACSRRPSYSTKPPNEPRHEWATRRHSYRPSSTTRESSTTVHRSNSVYTTRSGTMLTTDPAQQQLRCASVVSAARYHSARRSSAVHQTIGFRGGDESRDRPLTTGEAYGIDVMTANEVHRRDVYCRAVDVDLERQTCCAMEQLNRHQKDGMRQQRIRAEREKRRAESRKARQEMHMKAEERRAALEAERQQVLQASIGCVDGLLQDPYKVMMSKHRYSTPALRGSEQVVVAPSRQQTQRAAEASHHERLGTPQRRNSPQSVGSCFSSVTHSRPWR